MEPLVILNLIKRYLPYVIGVIALVSAYFYVDHRGYHRAEVKYKAEISDIKRNSAESEALAWRQKNDAEKRNRDIAQEADANDAALRSKYDAALLRLAKAQRAASQAGASPGPDLPQGSDGPSGSSELPETLTISFEDAKICAVNTSRLETVHDFATSMLADQSKNSEKQPTPTDTK